MTVGYTLATLLLAAPSLASLALIPRSSSRWSLGVALAITVPVLGPVLALVVVNVRGTGQVTRDLRWTEVLPPDERSEEVHLAAGQPSLLDRLLSLRSDERLGAIVALSHRGDERASSLLRWVVLHGDRDAVLDAALTLEDLELRWERRRDSAIDALRESPTFERALGAADATAEGIYFGLADRAICGELAARARALYDRAVELDPSMAAVVGVRRARLELAAGDPLLALSLLDRHCAGLSRSERVEALVLRSRAAFAGRRAGLPLAGRPTVFASIPVSSGELRLRLERPGQQVGQARAQDRDGDKAG